MHRRSGFTLIELLIVVVIIGILASIAIPKYHATKEKAYVATMKSDLRKLAVAEETYYAGTKTYFTGLAQNLPGKVTKIGEDFVPSSGVIIDATAVDGGWSAVAEYPDGSSRKCAMFQYAPPRAPAIVEGAPQCDP